jgi:hypothetical protein
MSDARTSINIDEEVRDELRRYKADDGLTYDEAVVRLLSETGWLNGDSDLAEFLQNKDESGGSDDT